MRVLVTGAAGFVGRRLVPRLERDGMTVAGVDRECDVSDVAAVAAAVERARPHAIVHLAAQSSVASSWADPQGTFRTNFLGTRAVLEAALRRERGVRVLVVGSSDQYGSSEPGSPPFDESAPFRPRSPYARSKAAADLLGAVYAERGLDVIRVRAFSHSGPGQSDAFVLSSFSKQVADIAAGRQAPVMRVGNLDSVRDFLDFEDVIDAYARLLGSDVPTGAYNVASGIGVPLSDHLASLFRIAGVEPEVIVDAERFRPTDISTGDATRLRRATGWEPQVPIETTLTNLVQYWSQRSDG